MRAIKNPGVVYSGRVGANMNIRKQSPNVGCRKLPIKCEDGPLKGHVLWLHAESPTTGVFTLLRKTGRYINGKWQAA